MKNKMGNELWTGCPPWLRSCQSSPQRAPTPPWLVVSVLAWWLACLSEQQHCCLCSAEGETGGGGASAPAWCPSRRQTVDSSAATFTRTPSFLTDVLWAVMSPVLDLQDSPSFLCTADQIHGFQGPAPRGETGSFPERLQGRTLRSCKFRTASF